jgi:hypothetical protein
VNEITGRGMDKEESRRAFEKKENDLIFEIT